MLAKSDYDDPAWACLFTEIGVCPDDGTMLYHTDSPGAIQIDGEPYDHYHRLKSGKAKTSSSKGMSRPLNVFGYASAEG